jgi:hypothetical protein
MGTQHVEDKWAPLCDLTRGEKAASGVSIRPRAAYSTTGG